MTLASKPTVITDFGTASDDNEFSIITGLSSIAEHKENVKHWSVVRDYLVLRDERGVPIVAFHNLDEAEVKSLSKLTTIKLLLLSELGDLEEAYQIEKKDEK